MASGLESASVDLDDILEAYVSGHTKAPSTGVEINGVDANQRYEKLSYGSPTSPTGISSVSVSADFNTIFAGLESFSVSITKFPDVFTSSPQHLYFTPTIVGGTSPFTYAWSAVLDSGTGSLFLTSSATASSVSAFMAGSVGEPDEGRVILIVTDAASNTASDESTLHMNVSP